MPLAFIILGILLIVTAYQGTYAAFGQQLYTDFSGGAGSNFIYWVAAVAMIGALGYVSPLRTPTRLLLALIIIAFFLANKGVWTNLTSAFNNVQPATGVAIPALSGPLPVSISGGTASGLTGALGGILGGQTSNALPAFTTTGTGGL